MNKNLVKEAVQLVPKLFPILYATGRVLQVLLNMVPRTEIEVRLKAPGIWRYGACMGALPAAQ